MAFNGVEIDMLSLRDADSLLVTLWEHSQPTYILIDGGYARDALKVTRFLQRRRITRIDHLVCSHMDNDHAAGLLRLVQGGQFEIGCGWVHRPERHVDIVAVVRTMRKAAALNEARSRVITNSLKCQMGLASELTNQGIRVIEPFEDRDIGFLTVLGPSEEYYEELVGRFRDLEMVYELMEQSRRRAATFNERSRKSSLQLLDAPKLNAENLSSTILATAYNSKVLLFTGDSGDESLQNVLKYGLSGCHWMQMPHHGSINNITQELVDYFSPSRAYVSAEGNDDHPHIAVVHAFKRTGARVFSTQNNGNLWFHIGDVPRRDDYGPAAFL